ncbi:MAG: type II secretion system protein GspL, partial [Steroidobacter sp.]
MAEALIIRFPSSATADETPQAQWMLVDAQHNRMGAVVTGSLQEAGALAANRKVVAVVNGSTVLHTEPVLPPLKGGTKLQQVVPFALEDQLATDVEELHFAIGKRSHGPGTPIAVVSHQQIQQWLFELQAAGLQPVAVVTDTSSVPVSNDGITVLIDNGRVIMRRADAAPTSLDISPLNEALQLLFPEFTETAVSIYMPEAEYDRQQTVIEALRVTVPNLQVKLLPEGALPLFAAQTLKGDNLNLLQGVYEPKRDLRNELAPWRTAAMFVGALFCLHLIVTGIHWWQLKQQETKLDQKITETFSQGMPGAS